MKTLLEIIEKENTADKLHLVFEGEIDETNADDTFLTINKYNLTEKKEVIFDFAKITYINSKTIGYLAQIYTDIEDKVGDEEAQNVFKIINTSESVYDVLKLVGLTSIINITEEGDNEDS